MRNYLYKGKPPPSKADRGNGPRFPQPPESILLNLGRHYHGGPNTVLNTPNHIVQSHIIVLNEENEHRKWEESQKK